MNLIRSFFIAFSMYSENTHAKDRVDQGCYEVFPVLFSIDRGCHRRNHAAVELAGRGGTGKGQ